jgi:hypothetical protein
VEDVGYEWEGLYSAVVDGQIQGPSGTYSYSIGYDDGSGYAEADNSAEADVEGQYTETGTDWEI